MYSYPQPIDFAIDKIIPRGGTKPDCIQVDFENYLSRVINLNQKIQGANYRIENWNSMCRAFSEKFRESITKHKEYEEKKSKNSDSDLPEKYRTTGFSYALTDIKLENEFEMVLFSISSTLDAVTRVVASFLKGAVNTNSHKRLSNILEKFNDFKDIKLLIENNCHQWINDIKDRRDAVAHYFALTIDSSYSNIKMGLPTNEKKITEIGLSKYPVKLGSPWLYSVPTLYSADRQSLIRGDGTERHDIVDRKNNLIIRREFPLPEKHETIDGFEYINKSQENLLQYLSTICELLSKRIN